MQDYSKGVDIIINTGPWGDTDILENYTDLLNSLIKFKSEKIHFLGGIYDKNKLMLLRAACLTYLHGHSVGGTNPSLLEAMGSKNICICHDNKFNREVIGDNGLFFNNEINGNFLLFPFLNSYD